MRIVHVGWFELGSVHGTHNALWQLARAQARAGHEVTILNLGWSPAPESVRQAKQEGVDLVGVVCPLWRGFWRDGGQRLRRQLTDLAPDIVHLQYVRIPKFLALARFLEAEGIPFVVSLHGGWKTAEMRRHRTRKQVYWHLIETHVHERAAGIHFVSDAERQEYYATLGRLRHGDAVIANIVEKPRAAACWKGRVETATPSFVSLGRYDIWHKGLDLAAALVSGLRRDRIDASLHLYGSEVGRHHGAIDQLRASQPQAPIHDHGPVFGLDKFERLASHDIYLQYSRFELFGMALVEALSIGMPVMVSEMCDLAASLRDAEAAVILPRTPLAAAVLVQSWLQRPDELVAMGARGRAWWERHCAAEKVCAETLAFYDASLRRRAPFPAHAA